MKIVRKITNGVLLILIGLLHMQDKVLPIGETYRQEFYQNINNTK